MQIDPQAISLVALALSGIAILISVWSIQTGKADVRRSLRMVLDKTISQTEQKLTDLDVLLKRSLRSRERLMSARGMFKSGVMIAFNEQHLEDVSRADVLRREFKRKRSSFKITTADNIEAALGSAENILSKVSEIEERASQSLAADDRERERLRQERLIARTHSVADRKPCGN